MAKQAFSSRILKPGLGAAVVPRPADTPTPGRFYQIRKGDFLTKVAKRAYGSGAHKLNVAINEAPHNRRFWRIVKSERHLFPNGRISFLKAFQGPRSQMEATSKAPSGKTHYAMIFIPDKPSG